MWVLKNRTAYAAERNWTRDKAGMHWWVVAVRATFSFDSRGRLSLADEQQPPVLAPEYYGMPGESSLKLDSDLLAAKPSTDILVLANAHAPSGEPTPSVSVALRVASIEKRLIVYGERSYRSTLGSTSLSRPRPFLTQPLRYEGAFGGKDISSPDPKEHRIDERNPVGRGVARYGTDLDGTSAHTIEYPNTDPSRAGPAGFGPIDAAWLPRRAFAGTYDEHWTKTKRPLLPDDYDAAFAMSSPTDQRLAHPLIGGERLALLNLTREGLLMFDLPTITLGFITRFGRRRNAHDAILTRVLVEAEEARLSLVWQSALRVPAPDADYLDDTEIVERANT